MSFFLVGYELYPVGYGLNKCYCRIETSKIPYYLAMMYVSVRGTSEVRMSMSVNTSNFLKHSIADHDSGSWLAISFMGSHTYNQIS